MTSKARLSDAEQAHLNATRDRVIALVLARAAELNALPPGAARVTPEDVKHIDAELALTVQHVQAGARDHLRREIVDGMLEHAEALLHLRGALRRHVP